MKRVMIGLAMVAAVAAMPTGAGAATKATKAKCHGKAVKSKIGEGLGFDNEVEANFVCNRAVKSFVIKTNKPLMDNGANGSFANHCKKTGARSYKCTGHAKKNEHIQTSFTTKAKHACGGKKLVVRVKVAKRTFKLRGPC